MQARPIKYIYLKIKKNVGNVFVEYSESMASHLWEKLRYSRTTKLIGEKISLKLGYKMLFIFLTSWSLIW